MPGMLNMRGMGFVKGSKMPPKAGVWPAALIVAVAALSLSGCTGPIEYLRNGLKVGPNYQGVQASTETHWIDANDTRIRRNRPTWCNGGPFFRTPCSIASRISQSAKT